MGRRVVDGPSSPTLHDPAAVHYQHPVSDAGDYPQIVRDEYNRHMSPFLHPPNQIDDLRLNRDIQRGRRFVGNEQLGFGN